MTFLAPELLLVALAVPLAWFLLRRAMRSRDARRAAVVGPRLARTLGAPGRALGAALLLGGTTLAALALAQPLGATLRAEVEPRGVDVVVCLDVSRSMLAADLAPSRLAAAKREVRAMADRAAGDRLGLVVFAGEARRVVPLTSDLATFAEMLETSDPLAVAKGGTDLGGALRLASEMLRDAAPGTAAVLLVTDGEERDEAAERVAGELGSRGIRVHCAGFGTTAGAKIPLEGRGAFLRDRAGREVVTALNPDALRRIAAAGDGELVLGAGAAPLARLYEAEVLPIKRTWQEHEERRARENRYQWPLAAAFLLWVLDLARRSA